VIEILDFWEQFCNIGEISYIFNNRNQMIYNFSFRSFRHNSYNIIICVPLQQSSLSSECIFKIDTEYFENIEGLYQIFYRMSTLKGMRFNGVLEGILNKDKAFLWSFSSLYPIGYIPTRVYSLIFSDDIRKVRLLVMISTTKIFPTLQSVSS